MLLALRMEETYENTAQIQSMYKERNEFSQNGATQPAFLPVYRELENNTEKQGNFQVTVSSSNLPPKNVDPIPKSNTQVEGTKVKLSFKDLWTPSGVVMSINMVSTEVVAEAYLEPSRTTTMEIFRGNS